MTKKKKVFLIVSIVLVVLIFLALIVEIFGYNDPVESFLFVLGRNRNSMKFPTPSDETEDIRITTVDRAVAQIPSTWLFSHFRGRTYKQIYYGYFEDGTWYDFPADNYQLKALLGSDTGYEAAENSHLAKIGQYVLLAFRVTNRPECFGTVEDSLNSETFELTQFCTSGDMLTSDGECFGTVFDNPNKTGVLQAEYQITNSFYKWYYLILKQEDLTNDYVATVSTYSEENELISKSTYTYEDIIKALNRE